MTSAPFFSIILSTWGRGALIRPTIESVLRQSDSDFELIVVGDGCADDTESTVRSFVDRDVSWFNLGQNSGSQSLPNNAGIENARAEWIAYIGHDDIWSPDHLQNLRSLIESDDALDFAVSGCVYHGPPGSETYYVTGLFDSQADASNQFYPPSSLAHRKLVVDRIGCWSDPRSVSAPVDSDFLLRSVSAGMRFRSTGKITVHKFAAGHRYLSYLVPDATEQWKALAEAERLAGLSRVLLERVRGGRGLSMPYQDYSEFRPGELFEANRSNKGLLRPPLRRLEGRTVMEQSGEPRGLDWHALEQGVRPYRWSGPSPHPKILIPYSYPGEVAISVEVCGVAVEPLRDISIAVNGRVREFDIAEFRGRQVLHLRTMLSESDYSILTLHTPGMFCPAADSASADIRRLGIAVSDIVIEPAH